MRNSILVEMKKIAIELISNLLLFFIALALLVNISFASYWPDPGPDLPRIYIRDNGNIQPETALIERTDNIYKLTGDLVHYTIDIQCDNIILDGVRHSIQGNSSRIKGYDDGNNGIIIDEQKNVTIKNINFEQGQTGVRISNSSNIILLNNTFSNGIYTGINLQDSTHILIENNIFVDLHTDIGDPAVMLDGSKITFRNNMVSDSSYGIKIMGSSNVISENTIQCILPIEMDDARSNILSMNIISGPVNWVDNEPYTGGEGIALFRGCNDNLIIGNNLSGFEGQAIRTVFSCSNNTFYANYFENNAFAIALQDAAVNNTFYGNTFRADSCKIGIVDGVQGTLWDNGTLGNYWGDYNGTDNNDDRIGDVPYIVYGYKWDTDISGFVSFVSGQDNYPLMEPLIIPEFPSWTPLLILIVAVSLVIVINRSNLYKQNRRVDN